METVERRKRRRRRGGGIPKVVVQGPAAVKTVGQLLANFLLSHVRPLPDDVVNEGKKLFNETRGN